MIYFLSRLYLLFWKLCKIWKFSSQTDYRHFSYIILYLLHSVQITCILSQTFPQMAFARFQFHIFSVQKLPFKKCLCCYFKLFYFIITFLAPGDKRHLNFRTTHAFNAVVWIGFKIPLGFPSFCTLIWFTQTKDYRSSIYPPNS